MTLTVQAMSTAVVSCLFFAAVASTGVAAGPGDSTPACANCPGDVEGDRTVDFGDVLEILGAWGPCPPAPGDCPADVNGSGTVDFQDLLVVLAAWGPCPPTIAEQITTELLRPNDDPIGRPLPVAAHWNTGRATAPYEGWDPNFVLDYLEAGAYVIPTFNLRMPIQSQEPWEYYESGLERARELQVPIAIRSTNWDRLFTDDPKYFGLPPAENPNVIDATDGVTILPMSDPDGPVERWEEVARDWVGLPAVTDMQTTYPAPPLVIWLDNFEQARLKWIDAQTSWRFVETHGVGQTGAERRAIIGDGWRARDGAMWNAWCAELTPAWQSVSIPVAYGAAFGRATYGSWTRWYESELHIPGRFTPWPGVFNASSSYYVFEDPIIHPATDYEVRAPLMGAMNWRFMRREAIEAVPDYFWEISVYDGGIERHEWYRTEHGQVYDKARYKGFVRFGLWIAQPRILREFRLTNQGREVYLEYWDAVLEAVGEVHADADLRRFWRRGSLVVNPAHPHPFDFNLSPGYTDDDVDRNFLLEAGVNPPRPWNNGTEIIVWTFAHVLGESPNREWMLFAYAPLAEHDDVVITIPGYGDVTVDVPRGNGRFWFFEESLRGPAHTSPPELDR